MTPVPSCLLSLFLCQQFLSFSWPEEENQVSSLIHPSALQCQLVSLPLPLENHPVLFLHTDSQTDFTCHSILTQLLQVVAHVQSLWP